jgi:hypothetical protein
MPLGSSSEAPVTSPGPSFVQKDFPFEGDRRKTTSFSTPGGLGRLRTLNMHSPFVCCHSPKSRVAVGYAELFFRGTYAPFLRASESPIAIACFRLFTVPPLPPWPDLSVPLFFRRIALATVFRAVLLYLVLPDDFFFAAMEDLLKKAIQKVVQSLLRAFEVLGSHGEARPERLDGPLDITWPNYGAFAPPKRINPLRTSLDPIIPFPAGNSAR